MLYVDLELQLQTFFNARENINVLALTTIMNSSYFFSFLVMGHLCLILEIKNTVFKFNYQKMNMSESVQCSKNRMLFVRLRTILQILRYQ